MGLWGQPEAGKAGCVLPLKESAGRPRGEGGVGGRPAGRGPGAVGIKAPSLEPNFCGWAPEVFPNHR